MNFDAGFVLFRLASILVAWGIPLALLVWFIRTLAVITRRLGDIVSRLDSLEGAIRDTAYPAPPSER